MLTFKQIEALYWVVQLGSFSKAAQKLCTTQSAITKRIQELESDLTVEIFDRSGQKAVLTRKGREVHGLSAKILAERDLMLMKVKGFSSFSGVLRLGITEITAITWLPKLIRHLRESFPKLVVDPKVGMAAELEQYLLEGRLDIAILHQHQHHPMFESEPLAPVRFAWVGGRSAVAADTTYTPEDLSRLPIIRQGTGSGLNSIYDDWLYPHKAEVNIFTMNSLQAMVGLVEAGFGLACVPIDYFDDLVRAGRLVRLQTSKPPPETAYCAMYMKDAYSTLYGEVIHIARAACDFSQPRAP